MRLFRRVGTATFGILLALVAIVFVLENQQPSSLIFLGWSTPSLPLAIYVASSLLIGMVIGPVAMLLARSFSGRKPQSR